MSAAVAIRKGAPEMLLEDIVALAHAAGMAIMEVYRGADFGQTGKQDDSPLTAADMASHRSMKLRRSRDSGCWAMRSRCGASSRCWHN